MAKLKGSICVHYASVELAENALDRARKMFLSTTPASFDRSRRDTNIVYFPRGVAANTKGHHVSDMEVEHFLRTECDGSLPDGVNIPCR